MIAYQLNHLGFSYRNHTVLEGLNMTFRKGKLHAIVGANGAGKSTLIKLLAGLLEPSQGTIEFAGKELSHFSDKARARSIAYMAQEVVIPGSFTAGEVVAMARYAHQNTKQAAVDESAIQTAMLRTHTLQLFHQKIGEISGGEKSRVLLARALAQDTQVLLLDEVTAPLDITHQLAVMEELRAWLDEDKTIVMVLHDINLAARYADEIWMLSEGRVYAHGEPEELITRENIQAVYEVDCLIDRNIVTDTPVIIPIQRRNSPLEGLKVHVVCGGGSGAQLLATLYNWGMTVSTGVLNEGDSDQLTAKRLGMTVFSKAAFSAIEEGDVKQAMESLREIDGILLTNLPVGSGNCKNLDFIPWAAQRGLPVLYCPWQSGKQYVHRNYEDVWEGALNSAQCCSSEADLKALLEALKP